AAGDAGGDVEGDGRFPEPGIALEERNLPEGDAAAPEPRDAERRHVGDRLPGPRVPRGLGELGRPGGDRPERLAIVAGDGMLRDGLEADGEGTRLAPAGEVDDGREERLGGGVLRAAGPPPAPPPP